MYLKLCHSSFCLLVVLIIFHNNCLNYSILIMNYKCDMLSCTNFDKSSKMVQCRGFCHRNLHGLCLGSSRISRDWYHPSLDEFFICNECQLTESSMHSMYDNINRRITELNSEKDGIITKLQAAISINNANFNDMAKSFEALIVSNSQKEDNRSPSLESRFVEHFELLTNSIDSSFLFLKESLLSSMKSGFDDICSDIINPNILDMRGRYTDLVRNQHDLSARIDELAISINDAASFSTKSQPQLNDNILNSQLDSSHHSDTEAALSIILHNDCLPVPATLHSELIAAELSIINEGTTSIISDHSPSSTQRVSMDPVINSVPINLPSGEKCNTSSKKATMKKASIAASSVTASSSSSTTKSRSSTFTAPLPLTSSTPDMQNAVLPEIFKAKPSTVSMESFFVAGAPLTADEAWLCDLIGRSFNIPRCVGKLIKTRKQNPIFRCFKLSIPSQFRSVLLNENFPDGCVIWNRMRFSRWIKGNPSSRKSNSNTSNNSISTKPNIYPSGSNDITVKTTINQSKPTKVKKSLKANRTKSETLKVSGSSASSSSLKEPSTIISSIAAPMASNSKLSTSPADFPHFNFSHVLNPTSFSITHPHSSTTSAPSSDISIGNSTATPSVYDPILKSPSPNLAFINPLLPPNVNLTLMSSQSLDNRYLLSRLREPKIFDNVRLYLAYLHRQSETTCIEGKTKTSVEFALLQKGLPTEISELRSIFDRFHECFGKSHKLVTIDLETFAAHLSSKHIANLNRLRNE